MKTVMRKEILAVLVVLFLASCTLTRERNEAVLNVEIGEELLIAGNEIRDLKMKGILSGESLQEIRGEYNRAVRLYREREGQLFRADRKEIQAILDRVNGSIIAAKGEEL